MSATDTRIHRAASTGNLILGASADLVPSTLWSGPIDDVRIYRRLVRP